MHHLILFSDSYFSHSSVTVVGFSDPQPLLERLYKLGSFLPCVFLAVLLNWFISFFWNFTQCSRLYMEMCMTARLLKTIFCPQNGENGLKLGFIWINWKFGQWFFLNLVYNESSFYLLYSCINLIFGKNLVPEIWTKVL